MFGLLNVNKPTGITSRDAVNTIQRLARPHKVGHAGTLDPLASGVLVVCIGPATRLTDYVHAMAKQYVGTFQLGKRSDTEDVDGEVVELDDPPVPTRGDLEDAIQSFIGDIEQVPPAYSALKVDGKRAHELAREGQEVALKAREVTIYEMELLEYEYPQMKLAIECSGGTYVRSLGRDLAESLNTAAVMSNLVRTGIGDFGLDTAVELDTLTRESIREQMLPPEAALSDLPRMDLTRKETEQISTGMRVFNREKIRGQEIVAFDHHGRLLSILTPRGPRQLGPMRNFIDKPRKKRKRRSK